MKHFDIIYDKYLDENMNKTIGGIQTYINDLCQVIDQMGHSVRIVQFSETDFSHQLSDNATVVGYCVNGKKNSDRYQKLYDRAVASCPAETLTIFATDIIIPKKLKGEAIAIQHGIFWDIPRKSKYPLPVQVFGRAYGAYQIVKRLQSMKAVVCVDYNFLNWYRTQVGEPVKYAQVIPNYTRIAEVFDKPEKPVKIIFARRLFHYRGTRVFTEAIKRILQEGYPVEVTVAGTGPDEGWMKEQLSGFNNVSFIQYKSDESLDIHKDKHIAVVPTVGSEGTSLSLLEAMSAQCAAICTNVGGMTNIVVDGYNGLMVNSGDVDGLYNAMKKLIEDEELRNALRKRGYETAKLGFSYQSWQERWTQVLKKEL